MNLLEIIRLQKEFYNSGSLLSVNQRIDYLKKLRDKIKNSQDDILKAIKEDLGKHSYESFLTEVQVVIGELEYLIKNLYKLVTIKNTGTSLNILPGKGIVLKKPFGQVLVQSPWNYPFQLAMIPTIGAIAAGNTVILKTSRKVPQTNNIIKEITNVLPKELLYFAEEFSHNEILDEKYDFYFFTGSRKVGEIIYGKAAENLAPVVLELGGKSPCIVDETAKIKDAVKKIAWGKFLNSGQTCVAPDYVFLHKKRKEEFIELFKREIKLNYSNRENLTKIITEEKVGQLASLINGRNDIYGGEFNLENRTFMPTILTNASFNDEIMEDEIFGPILPIIEYENLDDVIGKVKTKPSPLALYIFSNKNENIKKLVNYLNFGGACINDVIVHVSEIKLPFGGVGGSGLGNYHGKYSIDTFTHETGLVVSKSGLSNFLRYPPYTEKKFKIIKKILG
ncbi:MAG: aldehyde dehydrogenase family protein [Miniphocaeibacter sp.]|uniref:aldehyde dehydrogenase family protein n=1 Tax=Miniphocaeibacter sp. TaxID=3100973 RepID=UPI0018072B5F|nr:aldehyde dehydrogenase family protein [Gallicola sp.]